MKILNNCPWRQKANPNKRKLTKLFDIKQYYICFLDGKGCMPTIERPCPRDIEGKQNDRQ